MVFCFPMLTIEFLLDNNIWDEGDSYTGGLDERKPYVTGPRRFLIGRLAVSAASVFSLDFHRSDCSHFLTSKHLSTMDIASGASETPTECDEGPFQARATDEHVRIPLNAVWTIYFCGLFASHGRRSTHREGVLAVSY